MSQGLPRGRAQEELLHALEQASDQNVYACYQCGKCTAACPFSFSPQRVMRFLQLGQVDEALEVDTTWVCASCLTCSRVCPKGVNPAGVMRALRSVRSGPLATERPEALQVEERRRLAALANSRYDSYKHPLRSMFFANIHGVSRWGSQLAPVDFQSHVVRHQDVSAFGEGRPDHAVGQVRRMFGGAIPHRKDLGVEAGVREPRIAPEPRGTSSGRMMVCVCGETDFRWLADQRCASVPVDP